MTPKVIIALFTATLTLVVAEDQSDSLRRELLSMILYKNDNVVPDTAGLAFDTLPIQKEMRIDSLRPELQMLESLSNQIDLSRRQLKFRHLPSVMGVVQVYSSNGICSTASKCVTGMLSMN